VRLVTGSLPGVLYNGRVHTELTRKLLITAILALACAVALAACGSTKPKHSNHQNAGIAFSKCMRAHGVTNFPDPSGGGGLRIPAGVNPGSPSFQAAQTTCFKLMPGGGPLNQKPSAEEIKQQTQTSECMRKHGVTGFPDPIVSNKPPTSLNPANFSLIADRGGVIIEVPKSINPLSPSFEAAAKVCKFGPPH
jgi:hypothetical protein